jgi:16S rRNA (cytidine1402-2'-O)-methyltransferase
MTESAAADSEVRPGHLYVVATPIGHLGDLSPRAQAVLRGVQRICAEDTRNSSTLLRHFGIATPLLALHDHNEDSLAAQLVAALQGGEALALISDAGTPLISDPGFALVRAARAAGVPVMTVPGPCAAIAALSICGLPTDRFRFAGFLPPKPGARRERLQELAAAAETLVLYESSHRIVDCVADVVATLGPERPLFVGRELTKRFEESHSAPAAALLAWLEADSNRQRGEFVLIIAGAAPVADAQAAERVLRLLLTELPPSRARRSTKRPCDWRRRIGNETQDRLARMVFVALAVLFTPVTAAVAPELARQAPPGLKDRAALGIAPAMR